MSQKNLYFFVALYIEVNYLNQIIFGYQPFEHDFTYLLFFYSELKLMQNGVCFWHWLNGVILGKKINVVFHKSSLIIPEVNILKC